MPKRKSPKINYNEGDCFALPLKEGGYARGVITRMNGKGKILAYYFLPRFNTLEKVVFDNDLKAINAISVNFSGDPGLLYQSWPIIGKVEPWDRRDWPMPVFGYVYSLHQLKDTGEVRYYDEKTLQWTERKKVSAELASKLPGDGSAQNGWIESFISKIIIDIENSIFPQSPDYCPLDFMFQKTKELYLSKNFETESKKTDRE